MRRVELVEFPPELLLYDPFRTPWRRETELATLPPATFIRTLDVIPPRFSFASLERLLAKADKQLVRVADYCGATVVPHTWGLIKANPVDGEPRSRHRGYAVAAEVDRIEPPADIPHVYKLSHDRLGEIWRGLDHYYRFPGWRRLADIDEQQFMYGTNRHENPQSADDRLYLVDIEPLFRSRQIIGIY